jgi:hypothetical protein
LQWAFMPKSVYPFWQDWQFVTPIVFIVRREKEREIRSEREGKREIKRRREKHIEKESRPKNVFFIARSLTM